MAGVTINKLLSLMKIVRERVNELRSLRSQVAVKEKYLYTRLEDKEMSRVQEPQYDVKAVDQKITILENFLYLADSEIKASNARTEINVEIPSDLLNPLA
jgi:hypothetical protein